jgi:hypothetical protein
MFKAELAPIGRIRVAGCVDICSLPFDLIILAKAAQHGFVDSLPDSRLLRTNPVLMWINPPRT